MKYSAATALAIAVLTAVALGCSSNPVTPPDSSSPTVQEASFESPPSAVHHNLGYWLISVDTETLEVEPIALRSADWHFNLTGILNGTMGISAAPVPGESDPMNGLFVLDITLTHPFETKPQFSGFDVKGILMTPGTLEVGPLIFADADETELENADGYTRWWNPSEFPHPGVFGYTNGNLASAGPAALAATVNPYKYFADVFGPVGGMELVTDEPLDSDEGRGVFTAGSANTRRYEIRFPVDPAPQIVYGYAIDCSWAPPSPNPPEQVPDDFPIEANQPEAYRIAVAPTVNSLYYDSESGTGGGVLRLQINAHDWQGQMAGDIAGEVSAVRIFAPDLMSSGADGVFLDETAIKARYTTDLTGLAVPSHSGETKLICRVGSTDGSTYRQAVPPAPEVELSAFHAITLDIPDPECGTDTCNAFNEALDLDLETPTIDQLCAPDDYRDFFAFDIPLGYSVSGDLTLYCDAEPTKFGLYDETEALITEVDVSGGVAALDFDALGIMPGSYYLRVLTQTSARAFLYLIEPNLEIVDVTPHGVNVTPDTLNWEPRWVQAHDNIMIGTGTREMAIYDYTDKSEPVLLSFIKLLTLTKPAMCWPYMYVGDGQNPTNLMLIDLTDPSNPVIHNDVMTFSGAAGPFLGEPGYLYAAVSPGDIEIYDVSTDPASPTLAGSFSPGFTPSTWTLVYDGSSAAYWLALSAHTNQIYFYNVSDKDSIGSAQTLSWVHYTLLDVAAIDNYCLCLVRDDVDVTHFVSTYIDTGGPEEKGSVPLSISATHIAVGDGFVFGAGDTRLARSSISNPDLPGVVSTWTFDEANILDICVEGGNMYHALGAAGIRCITTTVADYGRVYAIGNPVSMLADNDTLYVGEVYLGYYAIKSADISDPAQASVLDEVLLDYYPSSLAADMEKLIMGTVDGYVQAIDCTDPSDLTAYDDYATGSAILALAIQYPALYVGTSGSGIRVYSLNTWPVINYTGLNLLLPSGPVEIRTYNGFMYAVVGDEIYIWSVFDPEHPAYLGTYTPLAPPRRIEVQGDYLYISTSAGLEIVDVSDPGSPVYVASESHPDAPHGNFLALTDQFAILQASATAPPVVMRTWPPDDPTVVGTLYDDLIPYWPTSVLTYEGHYYECRGIGIDIWDMY